MPPVPTAENLYDTTALNEGLPWETPTMKVGRILMSAADNLNPQLFHGTSAWLKPGEIIKPGTRDVFYSRSSSYIPTEHAQTGAYAAREPEEAAIYSRIAARRQEEAEMKQKGHSQRSLFAPVYEVEHVSENHDPLGLLPGMFKRDLQGFRVKKVAGFAVRDHGVDD